jgi:hypothetical protein
VTLGLPPTPASDVFALHAFIRNLLPFTEPLPLFADALSPQDEQGRALHAAFTALATDLGALDPTMRPQSVAELRRRYRHIRALAGNMPPPDFDAMRRRIAEAVRALAHRKPKLVVDGRARRVSLGAVTVDLVERRALWDLLWTLARFHVERPGVAVSLDELLEAGWPGEKVVPRAGRARIYVAISQLRKMGLSAVLLKRDDGYLLDPETNVELTRGDHFS